MSDLRSRAQTGTSRWWAIVPIAAFVGLLIALGMWYFRGEKEKPPPEVSNGDCIMISGNTISQVACTEAGSRTVVSKISDTQDGQYCSKFPDADSFFSYSKPPDETYVLCLKRNNS